MTPYVFLIAYLAVDYLQPATKIPALAALRPALVVGGLLLVTSLLYVSRTSQRVVFPRQSKLFLALLGLMTFSLLTALVRQRSWAMIIIMSKTFLIYFLLTQIIDTPRKLRGLIGAFVAIHVFVAIEGVRAFYSPQGREGAQALTGSLSKFLGDNNDFALAMVVIFPFAYFLMLHSRSWRARAALLGCLMLFGAGIMSTLSRGGQLGLAVVLGAIARKSKKTVPLVVLLVGLGLLFVAFAPRAYWERLRTLENYAQDSSAASRIYTWRVGIEMALGNPLGVGPANFSSAYGREFVDDRPEGVVGAWRTAHSVYFEVLGELGFAGLAIFLAMVVTNFRACGRLRRQSPPSSAGPAADTVTVTVSACTTALAGYLTSGAFLSAFYYPHFWYLTGFIVVAQKLAQQQAPEAAASASPAAWTSRPAVPVAP